MTTIDTLKQLVAQLRDRKQGCPWIIEQDFKSLVPLTIEESYELADSIDQSDMKEIRDELADLLLHLVLYAEIASEQNLFNFDDVAKAAIAKQMRRKLDFPNPTQTTAKEALAQWEEKKKKERAQHTQSKLKSILDDISRSLPAINRSLKLQNQAAKVKFDWPKVTLVLEKLYEEIAELKHEIRHNQSEKYLDELGDVLFTSVAIARHLGINPELALRHANNKFEKRFRAMENTLNQRGKKFSKLTLEEMNNLWEEAKQ